MKNSTTLKRTNDKKDTISVSSLGSPQHAGWMTKRGGKVHSWKRRWMVLKDSILYYFTKPHVSSHLILRVYLLTLQATKLTGLITLTGNSWVAEDSNVHKKHICLAISSPGRVFVMFFDTDNERKTWLDILKRVVGDPNAPKDALHASLAGLGVSDSSRM